MPLIFYIEPDIPDTIHTLTLSYTLYDITNKVPQSVEVARVEPSGNLIQQGAKP